jgi:hypothetical protein
MTSLVLLAAHSAFPISNLAVQHRNLSFSDLQGRLDDGSYRLGVLRNSYYSILVGRSWLAVRGQAAKGENTSGQACFIGYLRQS